MSTEVRTRVYALVVVGEAVVILALAMMLLLGFGEPDLGEFEQLPAVGSGAQTPADDRGSTTAAIGDDPQPRVIDASGEPRHDNTPARVPVQRLVQYEPDDPIGLVLYGVVFDPENKPLKSANIRLTSLESGRGLNARLYRDSGYAVAGLQPGPWRLLVTTNGHRPLRRTIQLTPSPARLRLDLYMQAATTVEVAVRTPDGKPLRTEMRKKGIKRVSTLVQAFAQHPGTRPVGVAGLKSSRNERARWSSRKTRPEADGSLEVLIELPCFVALLLGDVVLDCKPVAGGEELVTLTASLEKVQAALGSVVVNVAATDGAPLSRVSVRAGNASSYKRGPAGVGPHRLKHVRPGLHKLAVTASGRGRVYRWVRVQSGSELEVSVLLQAEGKVEGQVLGPDGPVIAASIRLYPLDPQVPATQWFSGRTGKKGQFKLSRVAPGDYQLIAYHSSKQLHGLSTVNVQPGPTILAPIMLTAGTGKLVLEASGLQSGDSRHVRIRDHRGRSLYRVSISMYGTTLSLPPGSHRYEVLDRNEQVVQTGTVVIGTEPAVLHVR